MVLLYVILPEIIRYLNYGDFIVLKFTLHRNHQGSIDHIDTQLTGQDLLSSSKLNKGCAFNQEEREIFDLVGLLPTQHETLEQQVARMYAQFQEHRTNLGKNIYLNVLHDYNETLFYKLVSQYLEEMLPIIYTPTVGEAVERFSLELRKPRGLYISYLDRDRIDSLLEQYASHQVNLAVATDGEAVLGIGDQGIGGINISTAKLMVYTLCGGLSPHAVLPIQLDVGTNNQHLLNDPMYLGWRHERLTGQQYDDFIDQFVKAFTKKFPHALLHWEDVGRDNARRILHRYRDHILTFNGDMQGTGAVALACVLAACTASKLPLAEHRFVIFGAGTAGVGITDQICDAFKRYGYSEADARKHFWLIDKEGLLTEKSKNILSFQTPYVRSLADVQGWVLRDKNKIELYDVVNNVKPTILVGCSTVGGAFTEEVVKCMAANTNMPVIMPLSNPTSKSEATPENIMQWTNGKAVIATGSPFAPVQWQGKSIRVSQSNNAFAFPGIGLGVIASRAKLLSDDMLWAATNALSECSPVIHDPTAPLLPALSDILRVSRQVAVAVAATAKKEGLSQMDSTLDLEKAIQQVCWEPRYYPYQKKS